CINFLVEDKNTGIDINALNNKHTKALDMLTQKERESFEIGCFHFEKVEEIHQEWLKERVSALMVVATLIAGIAFQAAINPPGGIFQEDSYVNARDQPVTFTYYLGSLAKSSKSSHFREYLKGLPHLKPNDTTFVSKLLGTLSNVSYGHDNPYVVSKSPGVVLEHEKWKPIISRHERNANFTPYLIRYAGTPILAYAHPNLYSVYIVCTAVAFLMSLAIIMLVITGPVYEHSSQPLTNWANASWLLLIGSYIAVFISMSPPFYDNKSTLGWSSIGGAAILGFSMFGYLVIRRKWKYWKLKISSESFKFISKRFIVRILALLYLFAVVPGVFLALYKFYKS
ncbi:hypothetical protein MKX03_004932, partial [Papaver bracteatum]